MGSNNLAPNVILRSKKLHACSVRLEDLCLKIQHEVDRGVNGNVQQNSSKTQPDLSVGLDDIVGVSSPIAQTEANPIGAFVSVYYYPKKKRSIVSKETRKKTTLLLGCNTFDDFEANGEALTGFREILLKEIRLGSGEEVERTFSRTLLVLINPKSGNGKGEQTFRDKIQPMLNDANVNLDVQVTEKAGQAMELMKSIDLSTIYGVMCISGDGLLFEVYQGLLGRADWETAVKLPVAPSPCGSGNALCCSLNYYAGEEIAEGPHISTYVTLKHSVMPMDLVAVDTKAGRQYSFLSVTWGLVADIDIESERYRYLGGARFTLAAVKKIASAKTYQGRVSFLPAGEYKALTLPTNRNLRRQRSVSERGPSKSQQRVEAKRRSASVSAAAKSSTANSVLVEKLARADGESTQIEDQSAPSQTESALSEMKSSDAKSSTVSTTEDDQRAGGDVGTITGITDNNTKSNETQLSDGGDAHGDGKAIQNNINKMNNSSANHQVGPVTPLLPPLNEPTPQDWVTIDDSFVSVLAVTQSHISYDVMAGPESTLDDGLIHLTLVFGGISRLQLLRGMLAMESGDHTTYPYTSCVKVKAFRIEPITPGGHISIDGELAEYGRVQGQVLPSIARVMGKPRAKK